MIAFDQVDTVKFDSLFNQNHKNEKILDSKQFIKDFLTVQNI